MHNEAEIRQAITTMFAGINSAWNLGDAKHYASFFTEDCDYITFNGQRLMGRIQVEQVHQKLFAGLLRGSRLVAELNSIRFLSPEIALVHLEGAVKLSFQREIWVRRSSINTNVVIRQASDWRVAAFQNTRIQKAGRIERLLQWISNK